MVTVTANEIQECYDFAVYAWKYSSQSQRQFGTQEARNRNSFIADQIAGKLAEYVFKHTIEETFEEVRIDLNFSHYLDHLQTDDGDVGIYVQNQHLPIKIDIKGSSHMAQWLLVEEHKYIDLETGEPASERYVMVKFSESVPDNQSLRRKPEQILDFESIQGKVIGWVNHSDFKSQQDNQEWFVYNRGNRPLKKRVLPKSMEKIKDIKHLRNYINKVIRDSGLDERKVYLNVVLDAKKNIGLPIHWLNTNLDELLQINS